MMSGEPVHLSDVLADPEYSFGQGPSIGNYRALLCVPLLREGRVEGVFALARPEPVAFTERQIEIVRAFADQAVIAIENARLFGEVQARTDELASSLQTLRNAQDSPSEKLTSLGQLTAGIAHEIKNPLNFVNNFSGMSRELLDELKDVLAEAPSMRRRAAKRTSSSRPSPPISTRSSSMAGGPFDRQEHAPPFARRVGRADGHQRQCDGRGGAQSRLPWRAAEKPGFNVTIVRELDPGAGKADLYPQEITRVLLNLISNGFYATTKRLQAGSEPGYEPTLTASTQNLGDRVEIAIKDNGAGIPDNVKDKMFNPFFTTKPAGEAPGWPVAQPRHCRQAARRRDRRRDPRRARPNFIIRLPRADPGADLKPGAFIDPLILVVDDEPDVEALFRQQFRRDLRAARFMMDFAQSAAQALDLVAETKASLILILSDVNMPGMSGLDFLPKARQARPDVPVIMITAYGDAETRRKAVERGAAGLFTKPIDFPELRLEIDRRIEAVIGST